MTKGIQTKESIIKCMNETIEALNRGLVEAEACGDEVLIHELSFMICYIKDYVEYLEGQ